MSPVNDRLIPQTVGENRRSNEEKAHLTRCLEDLEPFLSDAEFERVERRIKGASL